MKRELIEKLYDYLNFDIESVENDIKHDYLTENKGRNGRTYYWYLDEVRCALIDVETGEIIDDEEFIEKQFC
jgi:hypothetical protein